MKAPVVKTPVPVKEELSIEKEEKLPDLFFTVQLAALPDTTGEEMKKFSALKDVKTFVAENGYIRICSGLYTTHAVALENQNKLRGKGFADAFVTPYYKGKRITAKEAAAIKK